MDGSQGTTSIVAPEQYTVSFAADGRVAFHLDCNRATATWQSAPSADGSGGRLEFGPVASTRAMCAPPHLDQRLVRDLPHVRSYLFKDGKLFMSLLADGGIYEWRPRSK
jgi:heat shock protein HslJ